MKKWLAGIAATVIASVLIWWLTEGVRTRPDSPSPASSEPSSSLTSPIKEECHITGSVYNRDNNQPLANVDVGYFRFTQDKNSYIHGVKSRLATTNVDGSFEADCSQIEAENFPLRLQVTSRNWQSTFQTNEYIQRGTGRAGINIYVSDGLLRTLH